MTDLVKIPVEMRDLHKFITLSIDVFYVNKIIFFITLSQNICFTTVTHLSDPKMEMIFKAFKGMFKYYFQCGFQLMVVTGDSGLKPLDKYMVNLPGSPRLSLTAPTQTLH